MTALISDSAVMAAGAALQPPAVRGLARQFAVAFYAERRGVVPLRRLSGLVRNGAAGELAQEETERWG